MSEDGQKKIEEGLVKAMQAEHEGRYFYLMAADTTTDPQGREVFQRLAAEEQEHYEFLSAQLQAIGETGQTFYEGLAEWETGHYRALLAQQETLKEDYWSAGGFAPF